MKVNRNVAKIALAQQQLLTLGVESKFQILEEYWLFETEADIREAIAEGTMPAISDRLIRTIATTTTPPIPLPEGVESLLLDCLILKLDKVVNSYIERKLRGFGLFYEVYGEVERAGLCPCCTFYSINAGEEGLWDICPVCFWENGGEGPNHMSLEAARSNFIKFGAINERSLKFVDPDGAFKYARQILP